MSREYDRYELEAQGRPVEAGYWASVLNRRLTRRRTLATAGIGLAAAFLMACGGDSADEDEEATVVSKENASSPTAETPTLQRLSVGNTEIEYTDQGEGEPILLVHAGVFADWFLPLSGSPELAGFRVIRVRRAGYATEVSGHLTIGDHARHHALLSEHLGISALHVVGHSSGCCVSLQLALDRPDLIRSLVMIEPAAGGGFFVPAAEALGRDYFGPAMAAFAAGDLPTAFETFLQGVAGNNVRAVIEESLGREGYERALQESAFFPDEVQAVQEWQFGEAEGARVRQPVLNLEGGAQPEHTVELARQITVRVEELLPQTETVVVPGVSHAMPLQDPNALGRLIAMFVRKNSV